jgi:hypothetical protein
LEKLSTGKKIKLYELLRTFKREGIENFVTTRKKYVDVILSDYKRVLKENEELKISNKEIDKECSRLERKEVEMEKIIDLIIKDLYKQAHISTRCYLQISIEECMKNKNCIECLKQYFINNTKEVK